MEQGRGPWLTRTELARRIGRSESVVRHWCNRYRAVLPQQVGADGLLRFPLRLIQEIAAMKAERRSDHEIVARLADRTGLAPAPTWEDEVRAYQAEHRAQQVAILDALDALSRRVEQIARHLGI